MTDVDADGPEDSPAPVSDRFRQAIDEFNGRLFFECHETLEGIWMEDPRSHERRFFQGILQVAVGFLHLSNLNYTGARNLLARGSDKLEPSRPTQYGVDIETLLTAVDDSRTDIERLGPERLVDFDAKLIPTIKLGSLAQLEAEWKS